MMRDADGPTGGLAVTLLDALAGEGRECVFPRRGKTASLLRVGRTLEQLGRNDEALTQFEAIRDIYPNPGVIDNRIAYLKKNRKK